MTTLTDEAVLLAAILDNPADDAPRLVYADRLDELAHGDDPRAAFIRCQIELARLPACLTPSVGATIDGQPAPCRSCRPRKKRGCLPWCAACQRFEDTGRRGASLLKRWHLHWWPEMDGWEMWADGVCAFAEAPDLPVAVVRRGFVDRIECTAAAFLGEPCRRCEGTGSLLGAGPDRGNPSCSACSGTGRTAGAVEVFRTQPVISVRLTDAVPWRVTAGRDGFRWFGCDASSMEPGIGRLPSDIVRLMDRHPDYRRENHDPPLVRTYPTTEAALAVVSPALVAYGRSFAGLPAGA